MKTKTTRNGLTCLALLLAAVTWLRSGLAVELGLDETHWAVRVDMGGSIPQDPKLTRFGGPVSGDYMRLTPGFQMDMALDYKLVPWLAIGGEIGLLYNGVDSVGNFSYHDSSLFQVPLMANLTLQYPRGRFVPFVGAGLGGVASVLTFGAHAYAEPDGTGSDFVFGLQAYGGLSYRIKEHSRLGVMYRFLYTDRQDWNVEWWTGYGFHISVDPIQVHTFSLVLALDF